MCERLLATGERQEHLIAALLTLARSQRGLQRREDTDLAAIAEAVLAEQAAQVRIDLSLAPAPTVGDPRLLESLVTNLVGNAVRHNVPGGWARVCTGVRDGRPVLRVTNSGPVIPHERVEALFQPFQRFETRAGSPDGHGLGMSIVAAVAEAHSAPVTARPGSEGGLDITVTFGPAAWPWRGRAASDGGRARLRHRSGPQAHRQLPHAVAHEALVPGEFGRGGGQVQVGEAVNRRSRAIVASILARGAPRQ
ncbi:histidine kinase [Streptomyces alboflavus]|uniref:histidine kinase n=1 Tax=Streptomyces alboflavus TaxID=67267 RepID=A0A1Z1WS14_9ACTN|nr:histidine kinase [Streptomyces alboflavus]